MDMLKIKAMCFVTLYFPPCQRERIGEATREVGSVLFLFCCMR